MEEIQLDIDNEQDKSEQTGSVDLSQASAEDLAQFDNFEQFVQSVGLAQEQTQESVNDTNNTGSETDNTSTEEASAEEATSEAQTKPMTDEEFRQFITGEFRANHKTHKVEDPNDIRRLMQYGMNYHKKMAELAPHRKILKALEQYGLTDESKINFAIDLMEGKPEAIAQLLKQHEVDTYNLPDLEETPYQSQDYLPSDTRVAFDEVIDDIKSSQYGNQVIDYLKGLDNDSFQEVYTNPTMAQNLAIHAETGLMEDALSMLETERALGKVPAGIKDIDAYAYVAQFLEKQNPEKYFPQRSTARVLGTNEGKQSQSTQQNQAKIQASIPNNQQLATEQQSYSGIDTLLNASSDELAKYDNWEQFLAANNLNFER